MTEAEVRQGWTMGEVSQPLRDALERRAVVGGDLRVPTVWARAARGLQPVPECGGTGRTSIS